MWGCWVAWMLSSHPHCSLKSSWLSLIKKGACNNILDYLFVGWEFTCEIMIVKNMVSIECSFLWHRILLELSEIVPIVLISMCPCRVKIFKQMFQCFTCLDAVLVRQSTISERFTYNLHGGICSVWFLSLCQVFNYLLCRSSRIWS